MKILYITNMFPVRDYIYFGIHVKEQIQALQCCESLEAETYFINGRASKLNYIKSIFFINAFIRRSNFDIIHIHFGLSGIFLLFNPFIKLPVVLTVHGSDINSRKAGGLIKFITRLVVKRVQKVIVMNDGMASRLGINLDKVIKIPCGIDVNKFKETQGGRSTTSITIGFPGNRKRPEKNYELFREIVEQVKTTTTDVNVIEFHDMTRDEVVRNLNDIDILLLTSLSEGSPQIVKEAMACNKPVVSTDVGDVKFLLRGVKNSYVIDSFACTSFIDPIKEIISLPVDDRKSDGREKLMKLGLNSKDVADSIYKIYKELA